MHGALLDRPGFVTKRTRLLELLRARSFQEREVTLASGAKSNFYIDCRPVSLDAEGATLIGELFHMVIEAVAPSAVAVGGPTLGADPLATATSVMSYAAGHPRAAFIVRKEPKLHGTGQWIESGPLPQGAPVVVVEDTVTTGGSMVRAIERVITAGMKVIHCVAIVDRLEGGGEAIRKHAPLTTLFTRHDFIPS